MFESPHVLRGGFFNISTLSSFCFSIESRQIIIILAHVTNRNKATAKSNIASHIGIMSIIVCV